jgi:hypothetical protein
MLLVAGLPGYEASNVEQSSDDVGVGACIVLSLPVIQVQFRMNDYFMGDQSFAKRCISGVDVVFRNVLQHRRHIRWYRGQLAR